MKPGFWRLPPWNEYAHIEVTDKTHPTAILRDCSEKEFRIATIGMEDDPWEPWTPPEDVARIADEFWPTYQGPKEGTS